MKQKTYQPPLIEVLLTCQEPLMQASMDGQVTNDDPITDPEVILIRLANPNIQL